MFGSQTLEPLDNNFSVFQQQPKNCTLPHQLPQPPQTKPPSPKRTSPHPPRKPYPLKTTSATHPTSTPSTCNAPKT